MSASADAALLLRDFVNTAEPQLQQDDWAAPSDAHAWLSAHGLLTGADPDAQLDPADLRRLLALREALRGVLHAHAGHDADAGVVAGLNMDLARVPVRVSIDGDGQPLLAARSRRPYDVAVVGLLATIEHAVRDRTWDRLKACSRDTCRWAFYDTSRNRSARWCSMSGCGNIVKMRRAHARAAADSPSEGT